MLRFSVVRAHSGALVFRLVAWVPRLMVSVCSQAGASLRVSLLPSAGGYLFPEPELGGSLPLPFIFRYLCVPSWLPALYLNTHQWRCSFVEIQMYLPVSQADSVGVQDGLVAIQLDSGNQL